ncbi:DeoR/GlpR family DNA-binding transcription regulator [Yoonia sp. R2331]|uniref:DeoR/GlpR family DNA-binding transcription regulator n=1 Tax=Yoonia sp. R2331 TaxID=3237238 RepID=UPI0034E3D94F
MNSTERHSAILSTARRQGKVQATTLAEQLGVAVQTLRRDLRSLCAAGFLERVHGGAVLPSGVRNIGYDDRRGVNRTAKLRIARATAALIPDNASLFLNIGTTTEAVARALRHHQNLMVVTNNLNVANILADAPSCEVIVAGGRLRRADGGLVGDLAALAIARFQVDFAIIGASAIAADGHLLDFDPEEVRVSQQILTAARQSIVVADAGKFARKAPVRIGSLLEVDHFVTDRLPSERLAQALLDAGTKVQLA